MFVICMAVNISSSNVEFFSVATMDTCSNSKRKNPRRVLSHFKKSLLNSCSLKQQP